MDEYDYIVVGGGTAGSVLAARLSEDPGTQVLLLEAGSTEPLPAMSVPPAWPELMGSAADWGYQTTPQADAGPIEYPRGRALGGSGSINVEGVRVVDASVLPVIPNVPPNATVLAVAEKAAALITKPPSLNKESGRWQ